MVQGARLQDTGHRAQDEESPGGAQERLTSYAAFRACLLMGASQPGAKETVSKLSGGSDRF